MGLNVCVVYTLNASHTHTHHYGIGKSKKKIRDEYHFQVLCDGFMCFCLSFTTANIMCVDAKNVYVKRISVNMFNAELDNAVKRNDPTRI